MLLPSWNFLQAVWKPESDPVVLGGIDYEMQLIMAPEIKTALVFFFHSNPHKADIFPLL